MSIKTNVIIIPLYRRLHFPYVPTYLCFIPTRINHIFQQMKVKKLLFPQEKLAEERTALHEMNYCGTANTNEMTLHGAFYGRIGCRGFVYDPHHSVFGAGASTHDLTTKRKQPVYVWRFRGTTDGETTSGVDVHRRTGASPPSTTSFHINGVATQLSILDGSVLPHRLLYFQIFETLRPMPYPQRINSAQANHP